MSDKRFQFVWWWLWPASWGFRYHRWENGMARIYRYSLVIGPLEIRRWT